MPETANVAPEWRLINRNIFMVIPFLVLGICINEILTLGKIKDWTGLLVSTLALLSCSAYAFAFGVQNKYPQCTWAVFTLIGISIVAALVFLVLIMTEAALPDHIMLNRPRFSINSTEYQGPEEARNETASIDYRMSEIKSSWSLFTGSLSLLLNAILSTVY